MASVVAWWQRRGLVVVVPLLGVALISASLVLVARGRGGTGASQPGDDPVILAVGTDQVHRSVFDARVGVAVTAAQQGGGPQAGDPQYAAFLASIRARVLESLIIDTVIAQEARVRGVAATAAEIDREVLADTSIAGGSSQLATQLAEAGGSLAQLRDETHARLNEAQLEDVLASERAGQALALIHAGQDFATVAPTYSDDTTSASRGGNLGSLQLDQLRAGDSTFLATITSLQPGQMTPAPVRDVAGYEILRVDAATLGTRSVHRILIAAPQPYTAKERPDWFTQAVLLAVAQDCAAHQVQVLIPSAGDPCSGTTASPSASGSPRAATPTTTAPASGSGFTPRPPPAGAASTTPTP